MTDAEQREAARQFVNRWKGKGKEDEEGRSYWIDLLTNVIGMDQATERLNFEKKVVVDGHTKRIDVYIPETRVIIEQKSIGKALDQKIRNSGEIDLTPFEQADRYNSKLTYDERARWIVTSNFAEIWIYDMNQKQPEPTKIVLDELPNKYPLLDFLVKKDVQQISHEMEVSIKAGDIVGLIYDAFLQQYRIPDEKNETEEQRKKREHKLKSLNALCVRIVFCLYAEDAGLFGKRDMFHDYLKNYEVKDCRRALIELFKTLDTPLSERDEYLEEDLAQFPYVNGGLFADENIEIPPFTDEIKELLLTKASEDFNWRDISPTIFGAVFESTLNPETRRSGGMHYTSIENIHKAIDPLFLDDLKQEFETINEIKVKRTKDKKLDEFQDKLAALTFLDPACGSGNFLTETYLSLRRLENEVIREKLDGQMTLGEIRNPIRVSIQQFYGIEINDFAVTVGKTALWIAESQMLEETRSIVYGFNDEFLPLKTYVNIVEGNALRIDWNKVIPANKLKYIMGNPPFIGSARLSEEQKKDRSNVFNGLSNAGELDYVACWYKVAATYIQSYPIKCAFVSTNSICQGQQVLPLWKPLFAEGIAINFAHTTFVWDSEASEKAHVYCVIVGFSKQNSDNKCLLFQGNELQIVKNINAYLMAAPNIFIDKRRQVLCDIPIVIKGLQPTDNGYLILNDDEKEELLLKETNAAKWIRPFITAKEFIHGKTRWCLWLKDISPAELNKLPLVKKRVEDCYNWRKNQKITGDAYKLKDTPYLMRPSSKFEEAPFIVLPRHTGERRRYIPFGFVSGGCIPGDSISLAINASIYHFGVLSSNVHMAWTRSVCGRLKGDYRYSSDIVYNNFPWPMPTEQQKKNIEQTAQRILDARELYPDSSLADMYDPLTMPDRLRKAHIANDKAVMAAYGFSTKMTEADCVAELMKLYQKLIAEEQK